MRKLLRGQIAFACLFIAAVAVADDPAIERVPIPPRPPRAYRPPRSDLIYYVETDGRHVSLISADGRVLWTREPRRNVKLPDYRHYDPKIVFLGAPQEWMLGNRKKISDAAGIAYSNSQFGVLLADGTFEPKGQD